MYFESVFIKLNNFYINTDDIKVSKKFMKIDFFHRLKWVDPFIHTHLSGFFF